MRTLGIVLAGMAVLCVVAAAVGGSGLAGAADAPSLGSPIVAGSSPTTATVGAAGSGDPAARPTLAPSTSTTAPPRTAAPVSPPPVQVAGDDPVDDLEDDRQDAIDDLQDRRDDVDDADDD